MFHSADLLGLGVPSAGTNGQVNGGTGVTDNINKFYCKSNGVLYENDVIQVTDNGFGCDPGGDDATDGGGDDDDSVRCF